MSSFILSTLVPGAGAIISLAMYASPVSAVLKAQAKASLGDLNAVPFAVTVANCIVWLVYGLIKKDGFIVSPNAPGVAISIFCTLTTFALADFSIKKTMTNILCLEAIALPILGILTSFACADNTASMLSLWGLAGNFISLVYYAAPLSSMAEVIKKRDSSSILLPLTLMNTANAFLWTTYGLAISDAYVFVPNGIGALLSLAQLALSFIYPPKGTSNRSGLVAHDDELAPLKHSELNQ